MGIVLTLDNLVAMGYPKIELLLESVEMDEDWNGTWAKGLK